MTKLPDTAISAELLKAAAALLAQNGTKKVKAKPTEAETEARKAANDAECIKVFTAAGYQDVQPRVNVLTYGKEKADGSKSGWLSKGRRVKKGEKSLQVGPFRLFHVDQTEEIPVDGALH